MHIHLIAAARPNFMKIAPLYHALKQEQWAQTSIIHTGQHYDLNMSDDFFKDLGLPEPDFHLGVGSGTHARQAGQVMMAYEKVLMEEKPDLVIVVGDVNSTLACTLAASKVQYVQPNKVNKPEQPNNLNRLNELSALSFELGQRPVVAHLEAGLRSFDRTMPEEINRLVTDTLADILWTPSADADDNLIHEGISPEKIERVGNIMIDSLEMLRKKIEEQTVYANFGVNQGSYGLITLHRPSNVDDPQILESLIQLLSRISKKIPLIFPVHPRTRKNIDKFGLKNLLQNSPRLLILEPLNYIRFMNLIFNCRFTITDSGGIQEETTYLGIPCLTLRPNTERPITIDQGTNRLCKLDDLEQNVEIILSARSAQKNKIDLWDGKTAGRVVKSIKTKFNHSLAHIDDKKLINTRRFS